MIIGSYEVRAAHRSEIPAAVRLWSEVFEVEETFFQTLLEAEPLLPARATQVAVNPQGALVSSLQVFQREIMMLDGRFLTVGGIGSVCTREEDRRQGLSAALLKQSEGVMDFMACAWSLLFTGVHDHYARHGWTRVRMPYRYGPLASATGIPSRYRIEEVQDFEAAIPALATLHRQTLRGRPLGSRRSRGAWRTAIAYRMRAPHNTVLVAYADQTPAAYVHLRFGTDSARVCEAGTATEAAEVLDELGAAANRKIRERGLSSVEVSLPRLRRWEPLVARISEKLTVDYDDSAMVRVMDRRTNEQELQELFEHPSAQHFTADDF